MGNKREPQVRKSAAAASSQTIAPKSVARAGRPKRPVSTDGQGEVGGTSKSGAGSSARKRRKPFVL